MVFFAERFSQLALTYRNRAGARNRDGSRLITLLVLTWYFQGAGGGGYGDPSRCECKGLERGLEEGYVTQDGARRVCGVDGS